MEEEFVTIKTVSYPHELAVLQSCLEAEGVECFVPDELAIQVHNFRSAAMGGLRLQVKRQDAPRAMEILRDCGFLAPQDLAPYRETNPLTRLFMNLFRRKK